MTARALAAILEARLYVSRRLVGYSCAFAVAVASSNRPVWSPRSSAARSSVSSSLWIKSSAVIRISTVAKQSAPLFGRELGSSEGLVPCVAGSFATLLYAVRSSRADLPTRRLRCSWCSPAVVAATLVALSATTRAGWKRALYVFSWHAPRPSRRTRLQYSPAASQPSSRYRDRRLPCVTTIRGDASPLRSGLESIALRTVCAGSRRRELLEHRAIELREIVAAARRDPVRICRPSADRDRGRRRCECRRLIDWTPVI